LHTDEQPKQTRRVIGTLGKAYAGGQAEAEADADAVVRRHHALQRLLEPLPVTVPFAEALGNLFPDDRVEARRAFPPLLSMVPGAALLDQHPRDKDGDGAVLAALEDYHLARALLLAPLSRALEGGLPEPARRFFDRLRGWAVGEFTAAEAKRKEA